MPNLNRMVTHPLTIVGAIAAGVALGLAAPGIAKGLHVIGDIYIDLLKMIVLPFLVSAVIVSINRLAREPAASQYLGRIALFLLAGMAVAACAGVLYMHAAQPGTRLDQGALQAFGRLVHADLSGIETHVRLLTPPAVAPDGTTAGLIARLVPDNIFHALSLGDTLKALVFALLFGLALAYSPSEKTHSFIDSCEAVFRACQRLTTWMLYLLPIASFALAAEQIASTGWEPFKVMLHFIVAFAAVTALLLALCIVILWRKSGRRLVDVLRSQEGPFFIAMATRNSAACMPAMMTSLTERLGFDKNITELLVPLGTALFRVGPALYYCMATIFIAQLYGRDLTSVDYLVVVLASMLAGFSSTGMNGIVTISQTAIVCSLLGLPFEAAFVLFVAVEPVCDTLRTVLLVLSIDALVALVSPKQAAPAEQPLRANAAEPVALPVERKRIAG